MSTNVQLVEKLNAKLKRFAKKVVPERGLEIEQFIALEALKRVVFLTPVKLGRLRANWQIGIGKRPDSVLETKDKGGASTVGKGKAKIDALKPAPQGRIIWLSNNVEYATHVENGTPKMAPRKMLNQTLRELNQMRLPDK